MGCTTSKNAANVSIPVLKQSQHETIDDVCPILQCGNNGSFGCIIDIQNVNVKFLANIRNNPQRTKIALYKGFETPDDRKMLHGDDKITFINALCDKKIPGFKLFFNKDAITAFADEMKAYNLLVRKRIGTEHHTYFDLKEVDPSFNSYAGAYIRLRDTQFNIKTKTDGTKHLDHIYIIFQSFCNAKENTDIQTRLTKIYSDISTSLKELHNKGLVHRDIKPDNIMLCGEQYKLLDYGFASDLDVLSQTNLYEDFTGTLEYTIPSYSYGIIYKQIIKLYTVKNNDDKIQIVSDFMEIMDPIDNVLYMLCDHYITMKNQENNDNTELIKDLNDEYSMYGYPSKISTDYFKNLALKLDEYALKKSIINLILESNVTNPKDIYNMIIDTQRNNNKGGGKMRLKRTDEKITSLRGVTRVIYLDEKRRKCVKYKNKVISVRDFRKF